MIRDVRIALAGGLALLTLALALTLSSAPAALEPTHPTPVNTELVVTQHSSSVCQADETVPRGTTALRFSLKTLIGPRIAVKVLADRRVIASGARANGWTAGDLTVPVAPVAHTATNAKVCLSFALNDETLQMAGGRTPRSQAAVAGGGQVLPGRMKIEYLRPGAQSWWSLALSTARHMGLGRAWAGTGVALLVLALMAAVLALTVRRLLRMGLAARGRVPAAAWACALVACLSAAAWSIVTPPFQVTDEADHFAYVQQLALRGLPPTLNSEKYTQAEALALTDLNQFAVRLQPENHPIFAEAEQRKLETELVEVERLPQGPTGAAGLATGEPPLYYALETIPYTLTGGTVLERLALMRLLSALLAGITALFTFLFVREALPGVAWAWTVGALAVALTPLLGFMSGGVNPDAMLFAVSAATFYYLARAFRRGLTMRRALALGAVTGIGLVTKLNFIGLAPGVLLGLFLLTLRASKHSSRTRAAGLLALALATAAVPVIAAVVVNALAHRPTFGPAVGAAASHLGKHGSLLGEVSYIWQLYLPRLPVIMSRDFYDGFAPREIWFNGYVGLFGWLDTTFPQWVYTAALVPAALIAALCLRALKQTRATLRRRAPELATYAAIAAGLLLMLGIRSYNEFPEFGASYGEARYLLPLLPLLAAAITLAARAGGRRWGPIIGALIVILAFGHDIFSQLQVVARYYY